MQKMKDMGDSGFSLFETLVVIAIVVVLGLGGWYVYHREHKAKTTADATSQTNTGTTPTQQQANSTTQTPATTYLDIKEWGVKIPLSSRIQDAYYTVPAGISNDEDGRPSAVSLGLTSLNSGCGTVTSDSAGSSNALGSIVRALPTDTDPVSGKSYTELDPAGTTIAGYYYGYADAGLKGKTCSDSATVQSIDAAFSSALRHASAD